MGEGWVGGGVQWMPFIGLFLRRCVCTLRCSYFITTSRKCIVARSARNVCNSSFVDAASILQRVTTDEGQFPPFGKNKTFCVRLHTSGVRHNYWARFAGTDRDCGGISVPFRPKIIVSVPDAGHLVDVCIPSWKRTFCPVQRKYSPHAFFASIGCSLVWDTYVIGITNR